MNIPGISIAISHPNLTLMMVVMGANGELLTLPVSCLKLMSAVTFSVHWASEPNSNTFNQPVPDHLQYNNIVLSHDECCGKIDLFRVQNRVVHILPWWKCCQLLVYQTEGFFPERCSNFWLFWYQMCDCTTNRFDVYFAMLCFFHR